MDNSTESVSKVGTALLSNTSNPGIDLLFVNASNDRVPHRVGHRHDIRSHVRRHATKYLKPQHRSGSKKIAPDRKPARLTCRHPANDAPEFLSQHYQPHSPSARETDATQTSASEAISHLRVLADTVSDKPNEYGGREYQCEVCGARVHSLFDLTERVHVLDEDNSFVRHGSRAQNPFGLLGAGRVDPFLAYPLKKQDRTVHEFGRSG